MLTKEYREYPALSQSELKWILYGAEEFRYHKENPTTSTDAQNIGSAVHLLLLQPELFFHHVIPLDKKLDKRTKESKELIEQNEGKILLNPDDFEKVTSIVDSIKENEDCRALLAMCEEFETVRYYSHKGLDFKAQLDAIGDNFILDLKTTTTLNNDRLIRNTIFNYGYHFQAASYLIAAQKPIDNYFIIFVRTEPPYAVFPVRLSKELLDIGRSEFDRACDLYIDCLVNNPEFKSNNKIKEIGL